MISKAMLGSFFVVIGCVHTLSFTMSQEVVPSENVPVFNETDETMIEGAAYCKVHRPGLCSNLFLYNDVENQYSSERCPERELIQHKRGSFVLTYHNRCGGLIGRTKAMVAQDGSHGELYEYVQKRLDSHYKPLAVSATIENNDKFRWLRFVDAKGGPLFDALYDEGSTVLSAEDRVRFESLLDFSQFNGIKELPESPGLITLARWICAIQ